MVISFRNKPKQRGSECKKMRISAWANVHIRSDQTDRRARVPGGRFSPVPVILAMALAVDAWRWPCAVRNFPMPFFSPGVGLGGCRDKVTRLSKEFSSSFLSMHCDCAYASEEMTIQLSAHRVIDPLDMRKSEHENFCIVIVSEFIFRLRCGNLNSKRLWSAAPKMKRGQNCLSLSGGG